MRQLDLPEHTLHAHPTQPTPTTCRFRRRQVRKPRLAISAANDRSPDGGCQRAPAAIASWPSTAPFPALFEVGRRGRPQRASSSWKVRRRPRLTGRWPISTTSCAGWAGRAKAAGQLSRRLRAPERIRSARPGCRSGRGSRSRRRRPGRARGVRTCSGRRRWKRMANSRSCCGALRRSGLERPAPRMVRAPASSPGLAACAAFAASTRSRTPFSSLHGNRRLAFRQHPERQPAPIEQHRHSAVEALAHRPPPRRGGGGPCLRRPAGHSRRSNWNVRFFDSFRVACSHRIRSSSSASCRTGRCASSASRAAAAPKRRLKSAANSGRYAFAAPSRRSPAAASPSRADPAASGSPRSTRPLRLRRAGVDRLDVQRPQRPRELRRRVLAPLPVHPEHAVAGPSTAPPDDRAPPDAPAASPCTPPSSPTRRNPAPAAGSSRRRRTRSACSAPAPLGTSRAASRPPAPAPPTPRAARTALVDPAPPDAASDATALPPTSTSSASPATEPTGRDPSDSFSRRERRPEVRVALPNQSQRLPTHLLSPNALFDGAPRRPDAIPAAPRSRTASPDASPAARSSPDAPQPRAASALFSNTASITARSIRLLHRHQRPFRNQTGTLPPSEKGTL